MLKFNPAPMLISAISPLRILISAGGQGISSELDEPGQKARVPIEDVFDNWWASLNLTLFPLP